MSEFSHVLGSNPQTGAIPQVVVDWLAGNLPGSGTSGSVSLTPHPSWPWALIANVEGGDPDPDNHAPTVTINTASTVITDLDATLYWSGADVDGNPLTYTVDWGDGQTTNGATSPAAHTYATGGTFTATVTASDGQATGQGTHDFIAVDPNAPSAYHQAVMADGPLIYYPLDDATTPVVDATGTSTSTSTGWPTLGEPGLGDGDTAALFAYQTENHVETSANAALNGLTALTLECLVQPADNSSVSSTLICRDDQVAPARAFRLYRNGQKFAFMHHGGGVTVVTTTGNYPAGTVYHIALVFDGATMALYVNGTKDGEVAKTNALPTVNTELTIGNRAGAPSIGHPAAGTLAGVAVYTKALTPARITAHKTAAGIPA